MGKLRPYRIRTIWKIILRQLSIKWKGSRSLSFFIPEKFAKTEVKRSSSKQKKICLKGPRLMFLNHCFLLFLLVLGFTFLISYRKFIIYVNKRRLPNQPFSSTSLQKSLPPLDTSLRSGGFK